MTPKSPLRRLAEIVLNLGIRVAPRHATKWGQAMRGELDEVKGNWAALMWAAGGAGVLAKHAVLALVFPGREGQAALGGGGLFDEEGSMRKASLSVIGACAAAFLLFLLAPAFRQGLGVSLTQWTAISHPGTWWDMPQPGLKALERRAVVDQDPEALAFVAARVGNMAESTRLADEAVQLDPKLTWIYAMALPTAGESEAWIQKLKEWDPQNALPYFMEAENIDNAQAEARKTPHNESEESPEWKDAMEAAFRSSKLDAYRDRQSELDHEVAARYGIEDPYQVTEERCYPCLPTYAAWDAYDFGKLLLESGEKLEASGDLKGALEKYWEVARFGEMTKASDMFFMSAVLRDASERISALSEKVGDKEQAEFFASLADEAIQARKQAIARIRQESFGSTVVHWDADVVELSGMLLPIFGGILLICGLGVVARNRTLKLGSLRASRATMAVGLVSAIGVLLSSAMLYVGYRPYAEIYQQFVRTGSDIRFSELSEFLEYAQFPLGAHGTRSVAQYDLYFWMVVIALCTAAVVVSLIRYMRNHWRAHAAA